MDDSVEIGEMTVQYTAHGEAAKEEIDEFRRELRAMVASLEQSNPMLETYSFPEFDPRLSWTEEKPTETEDDE